MSPLAKVCFALAGGSTQKVHKLCRAFVVEVQVGYFHAAKLQVYIS